MSDRQMIADLLSALEYQVEQTRPTHFATTAIEAAREHLRANPQPEQEPVGWQWLDTAHYRKKIPADAIPEHWRPLYATRRAIVRAAAEIGRQMK